MEDDYQRMIKAYEDVGGKPDALVDSKTAYLVVHQNRVLGSNLVKGLIIDVKETDTGVNIDLRVEGETRIDSPLHLCFGILHKTGRQEINVNVLMEKGSEMSILAHCIFPDAVKIQHIMEGKIILKEKSVFRYDEIHYHGITGGAEVIPHVKINVGKGAHFITSFSLTKGRVGKLKIDYHAEVDENGIMEMVAKVNGHGDDEIRIRESGRLIGEGARGLIKSRIAVRERADSEIISELEASAPGAKGHVDCIEIVKGEAKAKAIPLVNVINEKAQVTHEAAIGKVNQKELETLMARGLDPEEAIDVIIGGMLK